MLNMGNLRTFFTGELAHAVRVVHGRDGGDAGCREQCRGTAHDDARHRGQR